jgi:hypothetical protein
LEDPIEEFAAYGELEGEVVFGAGFEPFVEFYLFGRGGMGCGFRGEGRGGGKRGVSKRL